MSLPNLREHGVTEYTREEVVNLSAWRCDLQEENISNRAIDMMHRMILLENPACRIVSLNTAYLGQADPFIQFTMAGLRSLGLVVTCQHIQSDTSIDFSDYNNCAGATYNLKELLRIEAKPNPLDLATFPPTTIPLIEEEIIERVEIF